VVAGHSAGSGLAAGLALRARDYRLSPPIRGQILPCPMLDDRLQSVSCAQFDGQEPWDRTKNIAAWSIALGGKTGKAVSPFWAPARAHDLSGLPSTYLEAGDAEIFRDEVVAYASRLWAAGVSADLHIWSGAFHGFDEMAPESHLGRQAIATKLSWVKRQLQ
jgi:acetyl esterase/lipase